MSKHQIRYEAIDNKVWKIIIDEDGTQQSVCIKECTNADEAMAAAIEYALGIRKAGN